MSQKLDYAGHGEHHRRRKLFRRSFAVFFGVIVLLALLVLIVWLVLRPSNPKFYLQETTVIQFNLTDDQTNHLTTVVHVTVSSRNPNENIGIYYDEIDVYAQYKGQRITAATCLPAGYQGHKDVTVWSPKLYGDGIPVEPDLAAALRQDENAGLMLLYVKVRGRIQWKVGTWTSGHYHLQANCPAFLTMSNGHSSGPASFGFQQISSCSVDVGI